MESLNPFDIRAGISTARAEKSSVISDLGNGFRMYGVDCRPNILFARTQPMVAPGTHMMERFLCLDDCLIAVFRQLP